MRRGQSQPRKDVHLQKHVQSQPKKGFHSQKGVQMST